MGISFEEGIEHSRIFTRSINTQKFSQYLEELRVINDNKNIAIFMDNLSVHHSRKTKLKLEELGIKSLFNIPYSPEYNGIELCFAKIKRSYKNLRASKLVRGVKPNSHSLILKSIKSLKFSEI